MNCRNFILNAGGRQLIVCSVHLTIRASALDDMFCSQTGATTYPLGSVNQRPFCLIRVLSKTTSLRTTALRTALDRLPFHGTIGKIVQSSPQCLPSLRRLDPKKGFDFGIVLNVR